MSILFLLGPHHSVKGGLDRWPMRALHVCAAAGVLAQLLLFLALLDLLPGR